METGGKQARAKTPEIKIHRQTDSHIGSPSPGYANSRESTPEKSSPKHVKGTRAKFIRQNPRFINTPICQMVPSEGKTVADCLDWKQEETRHHHRRSASPKAQSLESTHHRDYRPPSPETRPQPLHRFSPHKSSNIPVGHDKAEKGRVKISFQHQYDCRSDPNQPDRGMLHGSFVWEPLQKPPSSSSESLNTTDSPSRAKSSPS